MTRPILTHDDKRALRRIVEQLDHVEEKIAAFRTERAEILTAAAARFDMATLYDVMRLRRDEPTQIAERARERARLEAYAQALEMKI